MVFESSIYSKRPLLLSSCRTTWLNKHSRDTGHTAIYQGKPNFSWNQLPLFSPRQQTTYTGYALRTQLWTTSVTVGRHCRTAGRAGPKIFGPCTSLIHTLDGETALNNCTIAMKTVIKQHQIHLNACTLQFCKMLKRFWATVCKTVRPCYRSVVCLSCLWRWCIVAKRLDGSKRWNLAWW